MLGKTQNAKIITRKLDGQIHRSWEAELIEIKQSRLTFVGVFKQEIHHPELGVIASGTISYEYYWLDRWYNVFKFFEPSGEFRLFYCNINMPPSFQNNVLEYIDLDIDILVSKNLAIDILDLDEFEKNSKIFSYSEELKAKVFQTTDQVLAAIKAKEFPFSFY